MYAIEDGWVFHNAFGQWFKVTGLNDKMAAEEAAAYVQAGRAFGRIGMKRLENFFGVEVSFYRKRDSADEVFSDVMEDCGY